MTAHSKSTPLTVGHSVENRPIPLYLFSGVEPNDDTTQRLDTLFIGVFHGDEGISGELLNRLLTSLQTMPPAKAVGVVPVLNPDGLIKNNRVNAHGVDLNRNFPTRNWSEKHEDPTYFPGDSPGSEPETQVVIKLIEQYQPRKIITVHSPYQVINYDGPAEALAIAMAEGNGYPVVSDIGYPTPGSFGTYAGIERNIPAITLELPEDEPLETVWVKNEAALLAAITTRISTNPIQ